MIEKTDASNHADYGCEILSFLVLVILSALSHFWYIVIAICAAFVFCGAIVLLGQVVRIAAGPSPWRPRARQTNN